jgi:glycosyltransferase involved in cell wall biosynthesis
MGEGFSITPREALAMGKPCIVTNNTSQQTICNSGHVIPLQANKKISAVFEFMGNKPCGHFFDCDTDDLANSMKNVVNNYDKHLKQAHQGREWVKQYLWSELKPLYLNLLKPKNLVLGENNVISHELFQTNNIALFNKIKGLV